MLVMNCGVRQRTAFPSPDPYHTIQPILLLEFRRSLGHATRTLALVLCVYIAGVKRRRVVGHSQIEESKLARATSEFVDEPTGEIAAEDGPQVVIRDLYRPC